MKNFLLSSLTLMVVLMFSSCEKEDIQHITTITSEDIGLSADLAPITSEAIPANIKATLGEDYAKVQYAALAPAAGYEIGLADERVLYFTLNGHVLDNLMRRRLCGGPGTPVRIADLPGAIKRFLNAEFPDRDVFRARERRDGHIVVNISRSVALIFTADGDFVRKINCRPAVGDTPPVADGRICGGPGLIVPFDSLPAAMIRFLNANYPDVDRFLQRKNRDGNYIVNVERGLAIIFNADGEPIERVQCDIRGGDDHPAHCGGPGTPLRPDNLPQSILDFMDRHFPDVHHFRARERRDGHIVVNPRPNLAIIFNADGEVVERIQCDDRNGPNGPDVDFHSIDIRDLPNTIIVYIKRHYQGSEILRAGYNSDRNFIVFIKKGDHLLKLLFTRDGQFIREL